jgi:outer membrane receptor protein involved in Fe transport
MPFTTNELFLLESPAYIRQRAAFGNASYTFFKTLTLTAGIRYFSYDNGATIEDAGILYTGGTTLNVQHTFASARGNTPMVNISYHPNDELTLYASASKGFREGAGSSPVPTTGPLGSVCLANLQSFGLSSSPLSYDPDTVWTYEVGEKARLLGDRVEINSAVYDTQWHGVQEPVVLACGLGYTTNAADAEVRGGEIEVRAALTNHLTLTQSVGYAAAAFTDNFPAAGTVKGEPLFDVPRTTASTELQFHTPITNDALFFAGITNSFVSSSRDLTYAMNIVPTRDITNARVGVDVSKWTIAAFVNNMFDQVRPIEYLNLVTFTGPPYNRIATNQPLTAGVDVSVHF